MQTSLHSYGAAWQEIGRTKSVGWKLLPLWVIKACWVITAKPTLISLSPTIFIAYYLLFSGVGWRLSSCLSSTNLAPNSQDTRELKLISQTTALMLFLHSVRDYHHYQLIVEYSNCWIKQYLFAAAVSDMKHLTLSSHGNRQDGLNRL